MIPLDPTSMLFGAIVAGIVWLLLRDGLVDVDDGT